MEKNSLALSQDSIIAAVKSGNISPEQVEQLSKMVNLSIAGSLVNSVQRMDSMTERIQKSYETILKTLQGRLEEEEFVKELPTDDLMKYGTQFFKMLEATAEVKRKILNGRDMFRLDPLSKMERAMMQVMSSLNPKKKQMILEYIKELNEDTDSDDDFDNEE